MNKEEKVISQPLAKKIHDKAKEIGFELPKSECYWGDIAGNLNCPFWEIVDYRTEIPAYDIAELGEMLPGNIDGYVFQLQKGMMGNKYFFTMSKMPGAKIENVKEHEEMKDTAVEAMGKMFYYLLDNNLL